MQVLTGSNVRAFIWLPFLSEHKKSLPTDPPYKKDLPGIESQFQPSHLQQ